MYSKTSAAMALSSGILHCALRVVDDRRGMTRPRSERRRSRALPFCTHVAFVPLLNIPQVLVLTSGVGTRFLPVLTRFLEQPYENCAQQRQCVDDGDHVSPSRAAPCTSPAPHWGSPRGSSLRRPRKICWLVLQPPAPISPSISPVSETDGLGERVAPVENAGIHLHSRPYFSSCVKTLPKSAPAPCSPDC